jgi:hypothetical protein
MSQQRDEDGLLEEALRRQRQLADFYKRAAKDAPEKQCKQMFQHLRDGLEDQVGDVARELARHRMERGLGRPIDHQQ